MKRFFHFAFLVSLILLTAGCQSAPKGSSSLPLNAAVVEGRVEIQPAGKSSFEALKAGQSIYAGDILRSVGSDAYAEIRDSRSYIVLGPLASASVDELSSSADLTATRLTIKGGSILVAAEQKLGDGYIEVALPGGGKAAIHGSAMVINMDSQSSNLSTIVNCVEGAVSFNSAGGSLQMGSGSAMTIDMNGTAAEPNSDAYNLSKRDPNMVTIMQDRYIKFFPEMWYATITPEPTGTKTRIPSATPTRFLTWTPFDIGPTTTPEGTYQPFTRQPTEKVEPGASGLTGAELANQGGHSYKVQCQPLGQKCVCDSAKSGDMTITFDNSGVTLSGEGGELRYNKTGPNAYSVDDGGVKAEVTFFSGGWEFYVTKDGKPCVLHTYSRQ
jgi:hypothetical protein